MNVVLVTPNDADGALASGFLQEHGVRVRRCASVGELVPLLGAETGCVVLVEEALAHGDLEAFHSALQAQPPWSDLPLLLIAGHHSSASELLQGLFPRSGNVALLQRPLHPVSLVSAVNMALRARLRQLEVRDLLAQREAALARRDEFLAMLAHELRNPLAPIRNATYVMGSLDIKNEVFVRCRDMVDKQVRHITRLVDDLLDVSRLELGKVELRLQTVDIDESVEAAVEACATQIERRDHTVVVRLSKSNLAVAADPVRIEQAVSNLIVNAVKFTPPGGTIEVEVSREGAFAVVSVTDNGVGIEPRMLESIFDLFTQDAVTIARSNGGLGIGLTLVRRLAELHGGSVRALSAGPGSGARFEIRLPLVERAATADERAPAVKTDGKPKRVLVIEDREDTRASLAMLLSMWKHEVVFAGTGPEGVQRARESQPDVAIIDIGLPGLDGYQVAAQIRGERSAWARRIRLIALTGYGQPRDRERAASAGFDVHVLKPVDPDELKALLS